MSGNESVLECGIENSEASIKQSLSYAVYEAAEDVTHDLGLSKCKHGHNWCISLTEV